MKKEICKVIYLVMSIIFGGIMCPGPAWSDRDLSSIGICTAELSAKVEEELERFYAGGFVETDCRPMPTDSKKSIFVGLRKNIYTTIIVAVIDSISGEILIDELYHVEPDGGELTYVMVSNDFFHMTPKKHTFGIVLQEENDHHVRKHLFHFLPIQDTLILVLDNLTISDETTDKASGDNACAKTSLAMNRTLAADTFIVDKNADLVVKQEDVLSTYREDEKKQCVKTVGKQKKRTFKMSYGPKGYECRIPTDCNAIPWEGEPVTPPSNRRPGRPARE